MPPEATPHPVTQQDSTTPLISSEQKDTQDGAVDDRDPKAGKWRLFGLGKKKEEKKDMATAATSSGMGSSLHPTQQDTTMRPPSPSKAAGDLRQSSNQPQPIPITSSRNPYPSTANAAASPSRLLSGSPRLHSPASSEIFERSVQEPVQMSDLTHDTEAHIPSHVINEDHIPPALEASAQAITSEELNADEVEIVMSASHQQAASHLEGSSSHADLTQLHSPPMPSLQHVASQDSEHGSSMHHSSILPPGAEEDGASNYGQLDPNDVRRLSFISFADVVQSEHQAPPGSAMHEAGNRDSLHIASLPGSFRDGGRAASPMRSPRSPVSMQSRNLSGGVTTPPPGMSVDAGNPGSPMTPPSELTIETMRQAVRHTASGDLSVGRAGLSPVSDEGLSNASRSRGNS